MDPEKGLVALQLGALAPKALQVGEQSRAGVADRQAIDDRRCRQLSLDPPPHLPFGLCAREASSASVRHSRHPLPAPSRSLQPPQPSTGGSTSRPIGPRASRGTGQDPRPLDRPSSARPTMRSRSPARVGRRNRARPIPGSVRGARVSCCRAPIDNLLPSASSTRGLRGLAASRDVPRGVAKPVDGAPSGGVGTRRLVALAVSRSKPGTRSPRSPYTSRPSKHRSPTEQPA